MQAAAPAMKLPAVQRLVAIGDLHGDFDKTRRAFLAGGLIDDKDHWTGGTTTAVQAWPTFTANSIMLQRIDLPVKCLGNSQNLTLMSQHLKPGFSTPCTARQAGTCPAGEALHH